METEETEQMFDDLDLSKAPKKRVKEEPQFNIAIICSKKDIASMNIRQNLIKNHRFKEQKLEFDGNKIFSREGVWLLTVEDESLFQEEIDKKIDADLYVFATRHQSKEGVASLSLHSPGNWAEADFGGKEKELALCSTVYNKEAFVLLNKKAEEKKIGVPVTLEVTHHGPLLVKKPCFFIEIGSTEENWRDPKLGRFMADTIIEICDDLIARELGKKERKKYRIAVGIGGPHYANNFNKIQLGKEIAIGHICPKYQLENLDLEMLKQAVERTKEKVDFVLVDWKGLGEHKEKIKKIIEEAGLKMERVDRVR